MLNKNEYIIDLLFELSKHGMADFLSINPLRPDDYEINLQQANERGALNNIKKLTVDAKGKLMVELYDTLDVLTLLSKLVSTTSDDPSKANLSTLEEVIRARKLVNE